MRLVILVGLALSLAGCQSLTDFHHYISGPRGGCYYNDDTGHKVYVDHSYCS